jgi:hypothetical protein
MPYHQELDALTERYLGKTAWARPNEG